MIKTKYISKVNANMALCRTLCLFDNVVHKVATVRSVSNETKPINRRKSSRSSNFPRASNRYRRWLKPQTLPQPVC